MLTLAALISVLLTDAQFESAMQTVTYLADDAQQGRKFGSNQQLANWLATSMQASGAEPLSADFVQPFHRGQRAGFNVVGKIRGSDEQVIVVTAHFDHLGRSGRDIYHGADDNASGVAALLTAVQYFARHQPAHTVVFVATDGEESGLYGAEAFLEQWFEHLTIIANVNLDMLGRPLRGKRLNTLVEGIADADAIFRRNDGAACQQIRARRHPNDRLGNAVDWLKASDHYRFHLRGIPFVFIGGSFQPDYHQPGDTAARLNQPFFRCAIECALSSILIVDSQIAAQAQLSDTAPD